MPQFVVGDSNVFYNFGDGRLALADVLNAGETLHYSPVTVIEIASKITPGSFAQRKRAAQAILDSAAQPLLDPQSHLTTLFGYELADEPFDWSHAVQAIAQAPDVPTLENGVADYKSKVRRRVVISEALH